MSSFKTLSLDGLQAFFLLELMDGDNDQNPYLKIETCDAKTYSLMQGQIISLLYKKCFILYIIEKEK
ncbi:hypothetical protein CR513_49775, partial [Mucuna pruriens]